MLAASIPLLPLLNSGRSSGLIVVGSDRPSSIARPEPESRKWKSATSPSQPQHRRLRDGNAECLGGLKGILRPRCVTTAAGARISKMARMGHHPAISVTINKGEFEMNITRTLCLASIIALSIAAPVQAQSPKGGDYYAPGPTTPLHATPGQVLKIKDGDYYVGDTMILNHTRSAALKKCTDRIRFASDRYVACMSKLGEAP
jgi:hypothetical protein